MSVGDETTNDDIPTAAGMRQQVVHGVRWSAAARYGVQSIQLVSSLTLARLLAPENFGLMAMATVFVEFTRVCLNLGFSKVIVQRKTVDEEFLSSLFYFNIGFAALLMLILAACSPLVAWFYDNGELTWLLVALSSGVFLSSPSLVPAALLNRELRFGKLAVIDMVSTLSQATCAISLAFAGFGVWSLVGGSLTGAIVRPVLTNFVSPWRPKLLYSSARVREVFNFSANLTGFDIFNFFARSADNIIIGKFLGETSLGYYTMAYRILSYPRDAVSGVIGRVLLPTFSRLQNDNQRLAAAYLRICGCIAFVTFPMMLGLMAVAKPFVLAVLDVKWLPALPVIYIFCPLGMLQSIGTTVGHLFIAKGRADLMFRLGVVRGSVIIASFFAGLPWGIVGVATAYATVVLATWIPSLWVVFRLVPGLRVRDFMRNLVPHATYAITMAALVYFTSWRLAAVGTASWLNVAICVPLGVIVYSALVLTFKPPAMHDFLEILPFGKAKSGDKANKQSNTTQDESSEPTQIGVMN